MSERTGEKSSTMERHAQTLISTVIAALMVWVGLSVTQSRETIARLEERVATVASQVSDLKGAMADQYRRSEAERDQRAINTRIDSHEVRLQALEGKR